MRLDTSEEFGGAALCIGAIEIVFRTSDHLAAPGYLGDELQQDFVRDALALTTGDTRPEVLAAFKAVLRDATTIGWTRTEADTSLERHRILQAYLDLWESYPAAFHRWYRARTKVDAMMQMLQAMGIQPKARA